MKIHLRVTGGPVTPQDFRDALDDMLRYEGGHAHETMIKPEEQRAMVALERLTPARWESFGFSFEITNGNKLEHRPTGLHNVCPCPVCWRIYLEGDEARRGLFKTETPTDITLDVALEEIKDQLDKEIFAEAQRLGVTYEAVHALATEALRQLNMGPDIEDITLTNL